MDDRLAHLEEECASLNQKLIQHNELKDEIENLKNELETSLDTHKKLQEVALVFESENREIRQKYNAQLKEKSNLDVIKIELEQEIESKSHSYKNLEKRFNKVKEKLTNYEQLQDTVYNLQKENERLKEKNSELQDTMQAYDKGREKRSKEFEDKYKKLLKENNELNIKLESYIEETEELDTRNINLEKENNMLKEQFERLKDIEIIGSSLEQIQDLENKITNLEESLKKEKQRKEIAENELFKIEEEFECYKTEMENKKESGNEVVLPIISLEDGDSEENMKTVLSRKELIINNLNAERNELQQKIQLIEQAQEIVIEENNELTKLNLQHEQRKNEFVKEKQRLIDKNGNEVVSLQEQIKSLKLQLSNGDNHETFLELEQAKKDLEKTLELLKTATEKQTEWEEKLNNVEKEHTEKLKELQNQFVVLRDEDRNNLINELNLKFDHERTTYESRIIALNTVIAHLEERVLGLKSFYEPKLSLSVSGSTPSPESTPPVPLKNGRLHDSMDELRDYNYNGFRRMTGESDDELDEKTLTDRELRRISYKIASGNWSHLETGLRVTAQDASLIRRSSSNDQEKVYRILVSWRNDTTLNRIQLLKELAENIDPKRKDVIKFLKEMGGLSSNDVTGVKKRFRQIKKSIRR